MKFTVTIDRDEDGAWVVECPAIPGCVSQGNTKDEALENIKDAIKSCLEVRGKRGLLCTADGKEFLLAEVDDFEQEVTLVRQQPELLEFLEQRSHSGRTLTLDEARKALGLSP